MEPLVSVLVVLILTINSLGCFFVCSSRSREGVDENNEEVGENLEGKGKGYYRRIPTEEEDDDGEWETGNRFGDVNTVRGSDEEDEEDEEDDVTKSKSSDEWEDCGKMMVVSDDFCENKGAEGL